MNEEAKRAVRLEEAGKIARRLKNIPTGKGKLIQIGPYGFIGHFSPPFKKIYHERLGEGRKGALYASEKCLLVNR